MLFPNANLQQVIEREQTSTQVGVGRNKLIGALKELGLTANCKQYITE